MTFHEVTKALCDSSYVSSISCLGTGVFNELGISLWSGTIYVKPWVHPTIGPLKRGCLIGVQLDGLLIPVVCNWVRHMTVTQAGKRVG